MDRTLNYQLSALFGVLHHIRVIQSKLHIVLDDRRVFSLTRQIFETPVLDDGHIDPFYDTIRSSIGLEFMWLVRDIRSIKPTDPIIEAFPDIHYHLPDFLSRRKCLAREYDAYEVQWWHVAGSVYDDISVVEKAVLEALRSFGLRNP